MINPLTNTMNRVTQMLLNADGKLKEWGKEPYGVREATLAEQKQVVQNLTEDQMFELINKHGLDKVNAWLSRFENKEK